MLKLQVVYLWWLGWDYQYNKSKWIILEIIPPKEILAPLSAMEDVFSVIWSVIDTANWRETWCEGELPSCPYWLSWEIASIEGSIHFYVRCLAPHRHVVESVLFSHYPDIEINQVTDYTRVVPQNIPNDEWDLYGEDYILAREDCYPIKTYTKFFEPQGERISAEEKRIDPMISLLEGMARIGPGEHVWFQMITTPISDNEIPWKDEAKKVIEKISRRPTKKKKTIGSELSEMFSEFFAGMTTTAGEDSKEKSLSPALTEGGEKEMILTPGEREILTGVEEKIKKLAYKTNLRGMYMAKKSVWKGENGKIVRAYFSHFAAQNMNHIRFSGKTRSKVHYVFRAKRKHLRQKRLFVNYVMRFPSLFPEMLGEGNSIFNTEELTTIYHFPNKLSGMLAPSSAQVDAKKGGPPSNLPVE